MDFAENYATKTSAKSNNKGAALGYLVKRPLRKFNKLTGKDGHHSIHEFHEYHKEWVELAANFIRTKNCFKSCNKYKKNDSKHENPLLRGDNYKKD